jgi:hypothetical protein
LEARQLLLGSILEPAEVPPRFASAGLVAAMPLIAYSATAPEVGQWTAAHALTNGTL